MPGRQAEERWRTVRWHGLPTEAEPPELAEPARLAEEVAARVPPPARHGKRAQARLMAAPRPEGTTAYGKILSIFCFMVSAVKGLTM